MPKIQCKIVLLDEGIFLIHPITNLIYEYNKPHRLIGKIDIKKLKLIKS